MDAIHIALLVDDDPASRAPNRARLEAQGYVVIVAHDQTEALSRAKEAVPNLIVTHLVAGGLGNLPFIQALRTDDRCRHIPVMILTDHRDVRVGKKTLHAVPHDSW